MSWGTNLKNPKCLYRKSLSKGMVIIMDKKVKLKIKQVHDELNQNIKTLLVSDSVSNHRTAMRLQRVMVDLQRANSMQYVNRIIENANLVLRR